MMAVDSLMMMNMMKGMSMGCSGTLFNSPAVTTRYPDQHLIGV